MNIDELKAMLRKHEGVRSKPYHDVVGRITVGVGRNLDAKPLKDAEIEFLLSGDVADCLADCAKLPWFSALSEGRQLVVADMVYNLGLAGFSMFHRMIDAVLVADYDRAASEMLASKWAMQTGQRSIDLAQMMRAG
jgi:lysozyme